MSNVFIEGARVEQASLIAGKRCLKNVSKNIPVRENALT